MYSMHNNTNLLPKRIKSAAFINEVNGGINSQTLISESDIHTKDTTTESLFGHPLFGYNNMCSITHATLTNLNQHYKTFPMEPIIITFTFE
jgi:hypothetical protein